MWVEYRQIINDCDLILNQLLAHLLSFETSLLVNGIALGKQFGDANQRNLLFKQQFVAVVKQCLFIVLTIDEGEHDGGLVHSLVD